MDRADLRLRLESDLPACVEALRAVHEVNRWPDDPTDWLCPARTLMSWTAELRGRVVGHVLLTAEGDHRSALHRLFVAPAARGSGTATALLSMATEYAHARWLSLELDVVEDSVAAIVVLAQVEPVDRGVEGAAVAEAEPDDVTQPDSWH